MLDISNAVSVDMKGYTDPGTYNVPVDIVLPDGITLTSEVSVRLTLEKKPAEDQDGQTDTEEPAEDSGTGDSQDR